MNPHLLPDEIADWLAGNRDPERSRHMNGCPACSHEVQSMELALGEFRSAVAALETPAPLLVPAARRTAFPARWVLAAAAAAVAIATLPVYLYQRQVDAARARADAQLLEQVDAEVSQAVPGSMEPLVPLVSWNSSQVDDGETQ